ncbi:hypothetical protein MKZ38_009206 [Zalerion maritima]|uniref:Uncharacterized protein n=1 Tax=Zalerion maritima TaxID=339359 RepID=A0AAD5RGI6_9PEZI|nr:hypothetical protein MKZ38_009206 [Zalerion maritima]
MLPADFGARSCQIPVFLILPSHPDAAEVSVPEFAFLASQCEERLKLLQRHGLLLCRPEVRTKNKLYWGLFILSHVVSFVGPSQPNDCILLGSVGGQRGRWHIETSQQRALGGPNGKNAAAKRQTPSRHKSNPHFKVKFAPPFVRHSPSEEMPLDVAIFSYAAGVILPPSNGTTSRQVMSRQTRRQKLSNHRQPLTAP